ncbi:MAG: hypothetical protein HYV96_15270 [Opitutae bacterium]|nr:hypothetical protein [Opitutae bacterium]
MRGGMPTSQLPSFPSRAPRAAGIVTPRAERGTASLAQIEHIAATAVQLATLGPRLARLAAGMQTQADTQARHAGQIADATAQLAASLTAIVARLQESSDNVHSVASEIARIADQTRILALNASIEAARAGEQGRAFNVVAREVQQLADATRHSTGAIEERVGAIDGAVREVAASVVGADRAASAVTVQSVNTRVQAMATTAREQRDGAEALHSLGGQANDLTERLLVAVGTFRLAAHERAAQAVRGLLPELVSVVGQRAELEAKLVRWLAARPSFELLYVTDAAGRQITANLARRGDEVAVDPSALGRDWRERPWFRDARAEATRVALSDIYRSAATGEFCFTASAQILGGDGRCVGVLGADVNFQTLVAADAASRGR